MMLLKIIASGSKGNAYVFDDQRTALVVEAGQRFIDISRAVSHQLTRVAGVLITHEHGDHARRRTLKDIAAACIPVYCSAGTADALNIATNTNTRMLRPLERVQIGEFSVLPFATEHDAAEPMGFLIDHHEMGRALFATDTYFLRYTFEGLNHIICECNYNADALAANVVAGRINPARANRTRESHMSDETFIEMLKANNTDAVQNVVLLHMSGDNANVDEMVNRIQPHVFAPVTPATSGAVINLTRL